MSEITVLNLEQIPTNSHKNDMVYAGFWRRFGAVWVDFFVLVPIIFLNMWLESISKFGFVVATVLGLAFGVLLQVYFVRRFGGSPGKLALGLKIVKVDGAAVGYEVAILRYLPEFILVSIQSIILLVAAFSITDAEYSSYSLLGRRQALVVAAFPFYQIIYGLLNIWTWGEFIVMMTNKKRRAIHDFIAGTVVIVKQK